ncbi:hypothetical protein F7725_025933 [Dissostichus mawsoni]|uniref:Rab-GAP TBC domain-containing protein n=1 Tax=Dissostichus mawsoni TaxID=36200 RepID=A0A7J5X744_DISMA|nr:hypothetical protein F7725_025933 [Dissostichus mawsoni]
MKATDCILHAALYNRVAVVMKSLLQSLSQLILPHPSAVPPESCGVVVVLQLTHSPLSADIDMKKDIQTLIAEERADIILKYATGRQGGVQIDPWEDPDFSIYKVIDRFGFMHEDELPAPTAHEEKMVKRVYKGVPLQLRGRAWALMLDVERQKKENEGKYEKMKEQALLCSAEIKQIDLDINRTFRNHVMFMDRFGVKQQALFSVLSAYSVYNTIAALLLMFLNEEDAFWALSQLLTHHTHGMHGFFVPGFPKLQRFQTHHDQIISKLIPKLKKHLHKVVLQCFIDRTPFTLTLRLWDIFILEGERLLTAMSYTILKIHKRRMLKMSLEELREFLQERIAQTFYFSDDEVIEQLQLHDGAEEEEARPSSSRGKTSAAGLSLNIIDSPDQSPSKDPRDLDLDLDLDPEQEEESRVIIHSQLPPTAPR